MMRGAEVPDEIASVVDPDLLKNVMSFMDSRGGGAAEEPDAGTNDEEEEEEEDDDDNCGDAVFVPRQREIWDNVESFLSAPSLSLDTMCDPSASCGPTITPSALAGLASPARAEHAPAKGGAAGRRMQEMQKYAARVDEQRVTNGSPTPVPPSDFGLSSPARSRPCKRRGGSPRAPSAEANNNQSPEADGGTPDFNGLACNLTDGLEMAALRAELEESQTAAKESNKRMAEIMKELKL